MYDIIRLVASKYQWICNLGSGYPCQDLTLALFTATQRRGGIVDVRSAAYTGSDCDAAGRSGMYGMVGCRSMHMPAPPHIFFHNSGDALMLFIQATTSASS